MGPVESAVRADLAGVDLPDGRAGLAEAAYALAAKLDADAGLATAAVARELRATMVSLVKDEDDTPQDALAELIGRLSTPVRD